MASMFLSDVKNFMDYILKKSYTLQLINTLILVGACIYCAQNFISINHKIDDMQENVKKKVDHRYFNTTRSLEDIYNIRIDTSNGAVKN